MRKCIFLTMAVIVLTITAICQLSNADDLSTDTLGITVKQGAVMTWDDKEVKNLTTFEVVKTKKISSIGTWNALWDGWSLDTGFAYDASGIDTGALLLGRNFGTLGDYLPFDFPLKDKLSITIYPIGLYVKSILDHPETEICSGGALLKVNISL